MLSDSQMSTERVEYHGIQKQFVGNDFLLGGAGNHLIIAQVFDSLRDPATGDCIVEQDQIVSHVTKFLELKVTNRAIVTVSFLLVRPNPGNGYRIDLLLPATFRTAGTERKVRHSRFGR